jgi:hypothetical protein
LAIDNSRIKELETQGWTVRFIEGEPCLSEAIETYRDSGFEVHLEPLPGEMSCNSCSGEEAEGECRVCFKGHEDQYRMIFTRPIAEKTTQEEDLF